MSSQEMSGKTVSKNAWFILHFETTEPSARQEYNMLVNTYPDLPLDEADNTFGTTIHEAFGKMGDLTSGDGFKIRSLSIVGRDGRELVVNTTQIMVYLRELPPTALEATKPDLMGMGTNRVRVEFDYITILPQIFRR